MFFTLEYVSKIFGASAIINSCLIPALEKDLLDADKESCKFEIFLAKICLGDWSCLPMSVLKELGPFVSKAQSPLAVTFRFKILDPMIPWLLTSNDLHTWSTFVIREDTWHL